MAWKSCENVYLGDTGCVHNSHSGLYCRRNFRSQISIKLAGVQLYPQMHFQRHRHNCYTAACQQFYLPSPRHSFLHCSIKGKRLFSLFAVKWILYHPCVCISNLHFPECKREVYFLSPMFGKAQWYTLQLPRSHLQDTSAHSPYHCGVSNGENIF